MFGFRSVFDLWALGGYALVGCAFGGCVFVMAHRSPYTPASLGLQSGEEVLRGGYLKEPMVLTRLKRVEGRMFMYLLKGGRELLNFLVPLEARGRGKRPLANSRVFEDLALLRSQYRNCLNAQDRADRDLASNTPKKSDDLAALLDLDDDVSGVSDPATKIITTSPNAKWRQAKNARRTMPNIVQVTLEHEGFDAWTPNILLERDNMAVAMEATAANFAMLFRLVDHDLVHGGRKREKFGSQVASRPPPRGPPTAREYFVRNRWLTKIPVETSGASSRVRFRTLKRRKTEDGLPTRPKVKRSSGAQGHAHCDGPSMGDPMEALNSDI